MHRGRRAFCAEFFEYYNHHHRHSGIALHTPASMHFGTADDVQAERTKVLHAAYATNTRRFCNRWPAPPKMPTIAWINKPTITNDTQKKSDFWSQTACQAPRPPGYTGPAHPGIGRLDHSGRVEAEGYIVTVKHFAPVNVGQRA